MLRNKTAIISGATKGIGFSMAKVFSEDHGAFTIVCSRDINRAKSNLYKTLNTYDKVVALLESLPPEIYRSKGFLITEKGPFLMNYVAGRYTMEKFESKITELVFIGEGIAKSKKKVLKALESCILKKL